MDSAILQDHNMEVDRMETMEFLGIMLVLVPWVLFFTGWIVGLDKKKPER